MFKRRHYQLATLLLLPVALWGASATLSAGQRQLPRTMPLSQAELFFELNDTDGDLGIHAAIDGGTWTSLEIEGPDERKLLSVVSKSRLRMQGLTQLAFESAEPPFEELDPSVFFKRFPDFAAAAFLDADPRGRENAVRGVGEADLDLILPMLEQAARSRTARAERGHRDLVRL